MSPRGGAEGVSGVRWSNMLYWSAAAHTCTAGELSPRAAASFVSGNLSDAFLKAFQRLIECRTEERGGRGVKQANWLGALEQSVRTRIVGVC